MMRAIFSGKYEVPKIAKLSVEQLLNKTTQQHKNINIIMGKLLLQNVFFLYNK